MRRSPTCGCSVAGSASATASPSVAPRRRRWSRSRATAPGSGCGPTAWAPARSPGSAGRPGSGSAMPWGHEAAGDQHHFPPPTLEAVVAARDPARGHLLRSALVQLADQDPLIGVRHDDLGRLSVSLYGRVQQEVIAETLARDYGVDVEFADATVVHVERPGRVGEALEVLNTESNPYHATVGLRIDPGLPGSGLRFRRDVPAEDVPLYLYKTHEAFRDVIERHVRAALAAGLRGWQVTDCLVTLTRIGYSVADGPPSARGPRSAAVDYRKLTPIVARQALRTPAPWCANRWSTYASRPRRDHRSAPAGARPARGLHHRCVVHRDVHDPRGRAARGPVPRAPATAARPHRRRGRGRAEVRRLPAGPRSAAVQDAMRVLSPRPHGGLTPPGHRCWCQENKAPRKGRTTMARSHLLKALKPARVTGRRGPARPLARRYEHQHQPRRWARTPVRTATADAPDRPGEHRREGGPPGPPSPAGSSSWPRCCGPHPTPRRWSARRSP